jgi:hypothetical protein
MNIFLQIWFTIIIGEYAKKAIINPGIIYGCLSSTIIFNCLLGYLMFNEKMNLRISIGIVVVIGGVVWISIAKNSSEEVSAYDESEALKNRLLGIFFAIIVSFLSSLRPI